MQLQLRGSLALVTGAGRRIGREIAVALAQGGADLVLHAHTSSGEETQRAVQHYGRRAWIVRGDLTHHCAVHRVVNEARAKTGTIDILINNAAVFFPTSITTLTAKEWGVVRQTNMSAPFLLALLIGRQMYQQRGGKIVFLGDWSGRRPSRDFLPYCVSKAGVHTLTQALAKAFAPHVQVNEVVPGPVLLPEDYGPGRQEELRARTPLQRLGSPCDIARTVRFLMESGGFVTGASYVVDGGWLAKGPDGAETAV